MLNSFEESEALLNFRKKEEKAEFNFILPNELHPDILTIFDPDKMINDLSEIDDDSDFEFTGNYADDVCSMCKKVKTEHRSTLFDCVSKYREWGRETIEEWKKHL